MENILIDSGQSLRIINISCQTAFLLSSYIYLFTLLREDDSQTAQQLQAEISFRDL